MTTWDRLEHYRRRYAALQPGWEPATACYQGWVAERLAPGTRVLDLGCGRGGVVERLHVTGCWVGADPDFASLREHRLATLARCQTPTTRLPFLSAAFDLVIASWVLEHVTEPASFFREVARVLRPDGRFLFLTPNARHPIPRLSHTLAGLQRRLVPRFYGRSTADTFPVCYRANTPELVEHWAGAVGLRRLRLQLVADPAYFAWNEATFHLAVRLERWLPPTWKVHLIGEYQRVA